MSTIRNEGTVISIKSNPYIENPLVAAIFLMEGMERGVQTYIYVDDPVLTIGTLVKRTYKLLGKSLPSWHIPLSVATPIATVSDWTADLTGNDLPITAARIDKVNRWANFDASKMRGEDFEQPVSSEEALRNTAKWHLHDEYGESLPKDA